MCAASSVTLPPFEFTTLSVPTPQHDSSELAVNTHPASSESARAQQRSALSSLFTSSPLTHTRTRQHTAPHTPERGPSALAAFGGYLLSRLSRRIIWPAVGSKRRQIGRRRPRAASTGLYSSGFGSSRDARAINRRKTDSMLRSSNGPLNRTTNTPARRRLVRTATALARQQRGACK